MGRKKMDAMCKGEQFVVILLLLSCCGTSMSSIPRELSLFVYVVWWHSSFRLVQ